MIDALFQRWLERGGNFARVGTERVDSAKKSGYPLKDETAERLAAYMQKTKPGKVALITLLVHYSMLDRSREERSAELAKLIGGPTITQSRYYQLLREARLLASDSMARLNCP